MLNKVIPIALAASGLVAPCVASAEPIAPGSSSFAGVVIKGNDRIAASTLRMRGPASSCAQPKRTPVPLPADGYYTDVSNQWVNDGPEQCVKVDVEVPGGCSTYLENNPAAISLVAYLDSFDRDNPGANYLADIGTALTNPDLPEFEPSKASMSFVAPANSTIQFVLSNLISAGYSTGGCQYKFTVTRVDAGTGQPVSVPTLGQGAMWGLAGVLSLLGVAAIRRRS